MKERPILFSGEMVRAILDGRKTMTRRVIKPQPPISWDVCEPVEHTSGVFCFYRSSDTDFHGYKKCPYGQHGDRLWVKETWSQFAPRPKPGDGVPENACIDYRADYSASALRRGLDSDGDPYKPPSWRPLIHMPRWASRINLEVVSVRVERVQDISEDDARAEGISNPLGSLALNIFPSLWDSINLKRGYGWDTNPWVWVIEFKRLP